MIFGFNDPIGAATRGFRIAASVRHPVLLSFVSSSTPDPRFRHHARALMAIGCVSLECSPECLQVSRAPEKERGEGQLPPASFWDLVVG
jgi:hypothetical protein